MHLPNNQETEDKFPVCQHFEEFAIVHNNLLSSATITHKRPLSPRTPDKQAKRVQTIHDLDLEFTTFSSDEDDEPIDEFDKHDDEDDNELNGKFDEDSDDGKPNGEFDEHGNEDSDDGEPNDKFDEHDDEDSDDGEPNGEFDEHDGEDNEPNQANEPKGDDYIIREPTGGMVYDDDKARTQHNELITRLGWVPESDANNPLHPWKHEGEIWLTDLLFRSGNVSQKTADKFLGAFANGRISMVDGPIQFTNSREMLKLLDIAARNGTVCSNFVCIYKYGSRTQVLILLALFSVSLFKVKALTSPISLKPGLDNMRCFFVIPLLFYKN